MQNYQIHCFSIWHILLAFLPWQPIRPGFSLPLKRETRKDLFLQSIADSETVKPNLASSYFISPVSPTASGTDTSPYLDISRDIFTSAEQLFSPVYTFLCTEMYLITSFFMSSVFEMDITHFIFLNKYICIWNSLLHEYFILNIFPPVNNKSSSPPSQPYFVL